MEFTEVGVTYSFEETRTYNKFKYKRIFKGAVIDEGSVWVCGWHYEFLQLLSCWNKKNLDWKYVEVETW